MLKLVKKDFLFLRSKFEVVVPAQPIQVFEGCSRITFQILLLKVSSNRRPFEIEHLMYVSMWGKEIVHDNKVYLPAIWDLNSVKSVELGE